MIQNHTKSYIFCIRNTPPTILFNDIVSKFIIFYQHNTGIKPIIIANMNLALITRLLAYTLVIEAVVPDYFDRIDKHFGWN